MTTLSRVTGKVFGGSAPLDEIGQFGSAKAGTLLNTQDVATIQALPAYANGWGSAIMTSRNFPPIEEVTGVLKTISYQNCYLLQEGVPVYDVNTNYSATSIVKSINGTNLSFYVSLQDDNQGNSLSDTDYWAKASFANRTIGEIVTSAIPLTDSGLHLLDGSVLSGSGIYADFVSYIASIYNSSLNYFCTEAQWQSAVSTYGVCGKFVYDSVNNTVRLPKITGFIEGASGAANLGNLTEAGLPNITGKFKADFRNTTTGLRGECSGAFGIEGGANAEWQGAGGSSNISNGANFNFNASRSSSVYGNSNTVQPQSIKVLYYIVVATTTKTNIEVDIDEIATDLNGKADVDLSNTNDTAKILMSGMGLPSNTYENLTLGASGTTYTAPANGWVVFSKTATSSGQYMTVGVIDGVCYTFNVNGTGCVPCCYIPVKKNDIYSISYNLGGAVGLFRFIYANGSESEAS